MIVELTDDGPRNICSFIFFSAIAILGVLRDELHSSDDGSLKLVQSKYTIVVGVFSPHDLTNIHFILIAWNEHRCYPTATIGPPSLNLFVDGFGRCG